MAEGNGSPPPVDYLSLLSELTIVHATLERTGAYENGAVPAQAIVRAA
jgi:hypothetical protein